MLQNVSRVYGHGSSSRENRAAAGNKETYTIQRYFNHETKRWMYRTADVKTGNGAPGWVKALMKNDAVRDAVYKGMVRYLNEVSFTLTRLYRW